MVRRASQHHTDESVTRDLSLTTELVLDDRAPGKARRFISEAFGGSERLDAMLLATSELVTNAVRHTDRSVARAVTVTAQRRGATVRITVTHEGPPIHVSPGASTTGGWGLRIVERLADRWGMASSSKAEAWFELDGA